MKFYSGKKNSWESSLELKSSSTRRLPTREKKKKREEKKSALYAGSISDKAITRLSGVLDLLEPGDEVMADKGFLIQEYLEPRGCTLVIPHFLSSKGQFTETENKDNNKITNARVHVERAFRRCKEFHFFDQVLPLALAGSVNQLWAVCCLLTNFQGPLIKTQS